MKYDESFIKLHRNSKIIFSTIQKLGPLSKNEIQQKTDMKLTTLNRFMQPLIDAGFTTECEFGMSSGGRRPILYDVDRTHYALLGVDISRTYTQIVLTNLKLEVLDRYHLVMNSNSTPEYLFNIIETHAKSMLKANGSPTLLLGGIGAVGPMDTAGGIITTPIYFEAHGWHNVPITSLLGSALGCPFILNNGANAAAVIESRYGCGREMQNIVYVNCGIGIRIGAYLHGVLLHTPGNAEDVFGHMVIDADGLPCTCGKHGCLDCYASLHAILENYRVKTGIDTIAASDYTKICLAADSGEAAARAVIEKAAEYMGIGLSNLISLLNPDIVILSGPLVTNSDLFYNTAAETALDKCQHSENSIVFHRGGYYKDDAMSAGAAALAIETVLRTD